MTVIEEQPSNSLRSGQPRPQVRVMTLSATCMAETMSSMLVVSPTCLASRSLKWLRQVPHTRSLTPDCSRLLESGQDLGAGHGQLHPGINQNHAPQLRFHFLEGVDKVGHELASQEIIAPSQRGAAHED